MPDHLDTHAMLLRAEARALTLLNEHRPKTASNNYSELLTKYEDAFATARAVRLLWSGFERSSSPENRRTEDIYGE